MRLLAILLALGACSGGRPQAPWLFREPTTSVTPVQIDFAALEAGAFRFEVRQRSVTVQRFVRTPITNVKSTQGTLIQGRFGKTGTFLLARVGSTVTGVVREGSIGFEIVPFVGGHRVVPRSWQSALRPRHDEQAWNAVSAARGAAPTLVANEPVIIDVFFAYTPAVYKDLGPNGIKGLVANAIAELNEACVAGCPNVQFRGSIATEPTIDSELKQNGKRKDMHFIYTELLNKLAFKDAHAAREAARGDILVLLVDSVHGGLGLAKVMGDAGTAVAVADYHDTQWNMTIAHEIGHVMGALHDDDARELPYRFGHAFSQVGSPRTIMSNPCADPTECPLVALWSQQPLGDDDWRNNALVMRTTAAAVSKFGDTFLVASPLPTPP